jgi:DNA-binding IclR family transcriptional regulator
MTAFLVVSDSDEAVTVQVVEPTSTAAHVAYRPGTRHPLNRGAPGIALLAGDVPKTSERSEVTQARVSGWAYSEGEVIEGMASIAAPVTSADSAAVAIVHLAAGLDSIQVAPRVVEAARCLGAELA